MPKIQIATRLFWGMSTVGCIYGFVQAPNSVAWFASLMSACVPLVASVFLTDDRWDRSFLSILIYTLDGVALGIASAHFIMYSLHPWPLSFIPLLSGLSWWLHERVNRL
jgi:hypothetical protein